VATLTSLLVSFTVTPSLAGNWSLRSAWRVPRPIELFSRGFEAVRRCYLDRWLPWAMARPALVLSAAALSLAGALALVPLGVVGFEFIPAQDIGQIFIQVNSPEGTPLEQTRQTVLTIERAVDGVPDVQSETTFVGSQNSPIGGNLQDGALGQVAVYLVWMLRCRLRQERSGAALPIDSQDPPFDRHHCGVRTIVDPEFVHRRGHVRLHRAFGDRERGGNLLVGQSVGDEAQDGLLAAAEELARPWIVHRGGPFRPGARGRLDRGPREVDRLVRRQRPPLHHCRVVRRFPHLLGCAGGDLLSCLSNRGPHKEVTRPLAPRLHRGQQADGAVEVAAVRAK